MPIQKTDAIVLSNRPWRDTSSIVTLYTREFGRVQGVAKGGKRKRTRFGACLEMLTRTDVVYYEKEGREISTISDCTLRDSFRELRTDLQLTAAASYMVQLVDEMVRGREDSKRVFEHLLVGLELLRGGIAAELAVRFFELGLIGICGYHPRLDSCVSCHGEPRQSLSFSPRRGGLLCRRCTVSEREALPISPGACMALKHLQHVSAERVGRLRISGDVRKELREVLTGYIVYLLEKRPPALDFLERMIRDTASEH